MEEKSKMFFCVDGDKVAGRGFKEATNKTGFRGVVHLLRLIGVNLISPQTFLVKPPKC